MVLCVNNVLIRFNVCPLVHGVLHVMSVFLLASHININFLLNLVFLYYSPRKFFAFFVDLADNALRLHFTLHTNILPVRLLFTFTQEVLLLKLCA